MPQGKSSISLESAAKKSVKRRRKNRALGGALIAAAVVIVGYLLYAKLFIVRNIVIESNDPGVTYTEQQALAAAKKLGIRPGDHLFAVSSGRIAKDARYKLSDFDEVRLGIRLPETVVLRVKESVPVFYMTFGGETYCLSEGLRVTKRLDDAADAERKALKYISFSGVTKCVAGDFLETNDGADETLKLLCGVLREEGMLSDVSSFDLTNPFDVRFTYQSRFTAVLGDAANREFLVSKVRYLAAIAADMSATDNGIIDVSDDNMVEGMVKTYS